MTAYEIEYKDPILPKGATVQVDGIGILTNGETAYVSSDQADDFHVRTGQTIVQAFKGDSRVSAKRVAKREDDAEIPVVSEEPATEAPFVIDAENSLDMTNTEEVSG